MPSCRAHGCCLERGFFSTFATRWIIVVSYWLRDPECPDQEHEAQVEVCSEVRKCRLAPHVSACLAYFHSCRPLMAGDRNEELEVRAAPQSKFVAVLN